MLMDEEPEEFEFYDPDYDRVCSFPCHICGEEDDYDEEGEVRP